MNNRFNYSSKNFIDLIKLIYLIYDIFNHTRPFADIICLGIWRSSEIKNKYIVKIPFHLQRLFNDEI